MQNLHSTLQSPIACLEMTLDTALWVLLMMVSNNFCKIISWVTTVLYRSMLATILETVSLQHSLMQFNVCVYPIWRWRRSRFYGSQYFEAPVFFISNSFCLWYARTYRSHSFLIRPRRIGFWCSRKLFYDTNKFGLKLFGNNVQNFCNNTISCQKVV